MDHQQALATRAAERYLLEEMSEADRDAFEDHYFSCTECADDIRAGSLMRDGVTSGMVDTSSPSRTAEVVSISTRRRWHTSAVLPWAVAASLAVIASYQALWLVPQQGLSTQAVTPISLRPASRGAVITFAPPRDGVIAFALDLPAIDPAVSLTYDLRTVDDKSVANGVTAAPPAGTPLLLLVPAPQLVSPGGYVLRVRTGAGVEPPVAEYRFAVAKR
jgi:hypothetical protein